MQIKCSSCGKWNEKGSEHCLHCGELLDRKKADYIRLKKQGKLPKKLKHSPLFEIKETYPWWLKLIIYIVKPIYWTFFGIASVLLYIIAWLAT